MSSAYQQMPSIFLIGKGSPFAGHTYEANGDTITAGRSSSCEITLDEGEISRNHARFSFINGQWAVEDLNSSNGTFINGVQITQSTYLNDGDTIAMGKNQFTFKAGGAAEKATLVNMDPVMPPMPQPVPPPRRQAPPPQPAYQPPPQQIYQAPPPVQQVPVYVPVGAQQKRGGGGCWITCLIVGLVIIGIICIGLIGTWFLAKPTLDRWIQTVEDCIDDPEKCINDLLAGNLTGSGGSLVEGQEVIQLTTGQAGLVRTEDGASLEIPPDAVPPTDDGDPGSMNFSIEPAPEKSVSLTEGFEGFGNVYQLGPEGFTFNSPVQLTLPIPDDVETNQVMGLTYFDDASGEWVFVPGSIDEENRTVTVMTTHFSYWSIFGRRSDPDVWRNQNGGYIQVTNEHRYESGTYPHPDGDGRPFSLTYGICIESYNLDNPNASISSMTSSDFQLTVSDYRSIYTSYSPENFKHKWWLPNGTYVLSEVWHVSEVNRLVGVIPHNTSYWRPIGSVSVRDGEIVKYNFTSIDTSDPAMVNGRPNCFGVEDTSVGTGDIQVTLTWNASIDLDLYVTDPEGQTVYYSYTPIPSGGELDRDNKCSDMIVGRPENIYWPSGVAPSGEYTVGVDYYGTCGDSGSVSYTVRTVVNGTVNTYTGTIGEYDYEEVTTFSVP